MNNTTNSTPNINKMIPTTITGIMIKSSIGPPVTLKISINPHTIKIKPNGNSNKPDNNALNSLFILFSTPFIMSSFAIINPYTLKSSLLSP